MDNLNKNHYNNTVPPNTMIKISFGNTIDFPNKIVSTEQINLSLKDIFTPSTGSIGSVLKVHLHCRSTKKKILINGGFFTNFLILHSNKLSSFVSTD